MKDNFLELWAAFCDPENTDMDRVKIARLIGPIEVTQTRYDPDKSALAALREAADAEAA